MKKHVVEWLLLGTAMVLVIVVAGVLASRREAPAPVAVPAASVPMVQNDVLQQRFIRSFELAPGFFPDGIQGQFLASGGVVELALAPQQLSIVTKEAGRDARTVSVPWQVKAGDKILVVRDGERLAVCLNAVAVAQAEVMPDLWQQEKWNCVGQAMDKLQFQKTSMVFFADDFMHEESALGDWKAVSGQWKVNTLTNPVRSANAFSFVGTAAVAETKPSLALAGQWFWTNYSFASTVEPLDAKGIGWVFCYQDDDNTYKLIWQDRLVLTRRVAGIEQELAAAPIALQPRSWSRVEMENLLGMITVRIDGITVLTVVDPAPVFGGKIGLLVKGTEGAVFDDVLVQNVNRLEWTCSSPASSPCLRQRLVPAAAGAPAHGETIVAGMLALNSQLETTFAHLESLSGDLELQTRHQPNGDAVAFRIRPADGKPQGEILRRLAGQTETLATFPLPPLTAATRLGLHVLNDEIWVCADDTMVGFAKGAAAIGRGELRVMAPEHGASLASLSVQPQEQMPQLSSRVQTFEREADNMTGWSAATGEWMLEPRWGYGRFFAHRSDFWQDFTVAVALDKLSPEARAAPLGLAAFDPRQPRKEVVLRAMLTPKPDGKVTLALCQGDEIRRQLELNAMPASLALVRQHRRLLVKIGADTVMNEPLPDCLQSLCSVARLGAGSMQKWADNLSVCADGQRTDAFKEAPSDWQSVAGDWAVTNRWQCDPRWSFFSGVNKTGPACLWNKACHGENFSMEFFIGPKMDRTRGRKESAYAADFNATICADGKDLNSGYSFMYGGFADTGCYLMKRNQEIARNLTTAALISHRGNIHRVWFHVKIRKDGPMLTMWVDGVQMFQVKDDQPLTGNRFAIWTWKNGVMIAQVRVSSDQPLTTAPAVFALPKPNPQTPYDSVGTVPPTPAK